MQKISASLNAIFDFISVTFYRDEAYAVSYKNRAALVVANHQSALDPLIIMVAARNCERLGGKVNQLFYFAICKIHFRMCKNYQSQFCKSDFFPRFPSSLRIFFVKHISAS